jgi:hypothetical protein
MGFCDQTLSVDELTPLCSILIGREMLLRMNGRFAWWPFRNRSLCEFGDAGRHHTNSPSIYFLIRSHERWHKYQNCYE